MTTEMTPKEIVNALDSYIIGQHEAKVAVAIALRNRYRRSLLDDKMREDVTPRNIIMIGPTGVGKTEIARRLSKLVNAPFVKVEATKYTEVGYVGRDVESVVRDLAEEAVRMVTKIKEKEVEGKAREMAEERVLDLILPHIKKPETPFATSDNPQNLPTVTTRDKYRTRLREGRLDNLPIEIDIEEPQSTAIGMIPGMGEDMIMQVQDIFDGMMPKKTKKKKTTVANAIKILQEEEAQKLIDKDDINSLALDAAQYNGIIFIDEIDKIGAKGSGNGPDVSREGVQRDFLPINGEYKVRSRKNRSYSFYCRRCFPYDKGYGFDSRIAGQIPDKSRIAQSYRRRFQKNTHGSGKCTHKAGKGVACNGECRAYVYGRCDKRDSSYGLCYE